MTYCDLLSVTGKSRKGKLEKQKFESRNSGRGDGEFPPAASANRSVRSSVREKTNEKAEIRKQKSKGQDNPRSSKSLWREAGLSQMKERARRGLKSAHEDPND